jgi:filamentous hemagglutinin
MQAAVSSAIDSIESNVRDVNQRAEMVKLIVDVALANLGLPIHVLDPRLKKYEGLLVEAGKPNPSSGGYAEGGQVATTPHTGGSQLDGQQGGNAYVTPGHQLNPGVVYNENSNTGDAKGVSPVVTAEGKIGGTTFTDFNQTARPASEANASQPTLISDRVTAKADASGKILPNGNMADAHVKIGVLQQAYNSGKTQGADMAMSVAGKDVCGFCKGDIAAAAEKAGSKSLTVQAIDDVTGLPKTYNWVPGMRSIKETP